MDTELLQWIVAGAAAIGAGFGGFVYGRRNGRRGNPHSLTSIDRENIRQAMEIVAGEASREIVKAIEKEGDETRATIRALFVQLERRAKKR